jgi:hypothetical protein
MKSVYFFSAFVLLIITSSCNKLNSDHPQAEMYDEYATNLTSKSIINYTDSVYKNLNAYHKQTSLVYMLGDLSFYVEKYSDKGQTVLLVEHANTGALSNNVKKYFFKNDSLILEVSNMEIINDDGSFFKDVRTFIRHNTVFKSDNRTASTKAGINKLPYIDSSLNTQTKKNYPEQIAVLNDIINGTDKFDVVFENITTYPDSRYIILRSKVQNGYTASILVKDKDALIDSLLNKPMDFKDQKLNLKWIIKDSEAIYVPVANTSAKGLNK